MSLVLLLSLQNSSERLTSALDKFNREYPQEKVYLHLDKPYYYSGEDIWFKAYLVAGPDHLPSQFSDNVYAELIDSDGNMLFRNRILLDKGFGKGDFELPELPSGNYIIRAYSHWMRNFDAEFFFEKEVAIISPIDGNPLAKAEDEKLVLSFHPEGGDLVAYVKSRVVVKASANSRIGNDHKVLIYKGDSVLTHLKTNSDGIAQFEITPETGAHYHAIIEGQEGEFELPKVQPKGFVLQVDAQQNEASVAVEVHTHNPEKATQRLYLIGQSRGSITFAAQLGFQESMARLSIPKKDLMDGITHLTLFNEQWLPEAERLFFHQGNQSLNISISTDQSLYTARDSTIVNIEVTDHAGKPVQGSFSLTALDAEQINAALDKEHIMSNLLLSSDLKGYIPNAARFFSDSARYQAPALDLIMMCHGWRRFTWKDLQAEEYPEIQYGVQRGITVQGRMLTKKGGDPVKGATVSHIGTFNEMPSLANTESLNEGFFVLGNLYFYDQEENYLQGRIKGRKKKMKELFVEVDTNAIDYAQINLHTVPVAGLDTTVIEDHIEKSIERQQIATFMEFDDEARDLGVFVVEDYRPDEIDKYGAEYHQLDFDKYAQQASYGATAMDILRSRMPNVIIRGIGASMQPILTYNTTIRYPNLNPLIMLDGLPINIYELRALPAYRVKKAEVYKGTQEYLKAGRKPDEAMRGGVLEFTTRTEEEILEYFRMIGDKDVKSLPGGFYKSRDFFAPRYGGDIPDNPVPDKRMLIHWAPMVTTNAEGKAQLSFFNADLATTIDIEVQGLSLKGQVGVGKHSYQVKQRSIASK